MNSFSALQPERLTDTVYALLRERILSGTFGPGDRLNVDELARQLNISQTPIKGALTMLAVDGLIVVHPRRGTFIAQVSPQDISDMLAIRRALELLAAESAIHNVSSDDIEALRLQIQQIASAKDVDAHYRGNYDFHMRLVRLSGNGKLVEFYGHLNAHIHMALIHSVSNDWRDRSIAESAEHTAIVDALEARDAKALTEAIVAHLRRASESLHRDLCNRDGFQETNEAPLHTRNEKGKS